MLGFRAARLADAPGALLVNQLPLASPLKTPATAGAFVYRRPPPTSRRPDGDFSRFFILPVLCSAGFRSRQS
jgi:hypothetical protein